MIIGKLKKSREGAIKIIQNDVISWLSYPYGYRSSLALFENKFKERSFSTLLSVTFYTQVNDFDFFPKNFYVAVAV